MPTDMQLRLPVVIFDGFIEPRLFCISDAVVFPCRVYVEITLIDSVLFAGRNTSSQWPMLWKRSGLITCIFF